MSQALPETFSVLLSLVNSHDVAAKMEALPDAQACQAWFQAHHFRQDPTFTDRDVFAVHQLREGIRALWLAHNGGVLTEGSVQNLNSILASVDFYCRVDATGQLTMAVGDHNHGTYLGQLLTLLIDASQDPGWPRLKVCQNPACRWAFYDQSRNHSHRWCSMTACGSREKSRRYRERQRYR